jgi:hypothetical protein
MALGKGRRLKGRRSNGSNHPDEVMVLFGFARWYFFHGPDTHYTPSITVFRTAEVQQDLKFYHPF